MTVATNMEYTIIKSSRKTISIEIKKGEVIVRAPRLLPKFRIEAFVNSKAEWIRKSLEKQQEFIKAAEETVALDDGVIEALKIKAKEILPKKAEYFADLMGLKYGKITIRRQRTRWGSCSSKGNLNFNCLLMFCPDNVIDYIVVHELCHLKQMNHSADFWAEVEKVLPDYKTAKKWLKENEKRIVLK